MNRNPLAAVRSGATAGAPTRRETLGLLSSVGIGLASLLGGDVEAKPATNRKRLKMAKAEKKKVKGDPRCNCRELLSKNGTCIDVTNPVTVFAAQCSPTCFCVADNPGRPTACVQLTCEEQCTTDDDCPGESFCANTAGCCIDHPEYARTCVTTCPTA